MKVYLTYECYFRDDGTFKKVLRKIFTDDAKASDYVDGYKDSLLSWVECEERTTE